MPSLFDDPDTLTEDDDAELDAEEPGEEDEDEQPDGALFEDDTPAEAKRARLKAEQEESRRKHWAELSASLPTVEPAPVDDRDYRALLRAVMHTDHTDEINLWVLGLNSGVWEWEEGFRPALARLVADGVLALLDTEGQVRISRAKLPDEYRADPWPKALAYLAHHAHGSSIDAHELRYKANIYQHAQAEAVIERLRAEGYIDLKGRILRRPTGATVERFEFPGLRGAEADLVIMRYQARGTVNAHEPQSEPIGWHAYMGISVRTTKDSSAGRSGPVWPEGHTSGDDESEQWPTREAALEAGALAIARQAEEIEASVDIHADWKPDIRRAARSIRDWAELLLKRRIPRILADGWARERYEGLCRMREESKRYGSDNGAKLQPPPEPQPDVPAQADAEGQFSLF